MRSQSPLGLLARVVRLHPRATLSMIGALGASFAAGWAIAPREGGAAPPVIVEGSASTEGPEEARLGVVIADFEGLARGARVEILAEGLVDAPAADAMYLARPLLIRRAGGPRWVPGDVVAVERPGALGGSLDERRDLDGDGCEDHLWHAVRRYVPREEGDRQELQGYLVFDGCRGGALVELGMRSDWGSSEVVAHRRFRDLVGGPAEELVVLLETTVTEVGRGEHRIQVFRFDADRIERVLDHGVGDPVGTGLAQYEVGYLRFREDGSLVSRKLVTRPAGQPPHVREETWTRNAHGSLDRRSEELPLYAEDGRRVVAIENAQVGVDPASFEGPRALIVVDAEGRREERVGGALADERFERALELGEAPAEDIWDWIDGFWFFND